MTDDSAPAPGPSRPDALFPRDPEAPETPAFPEEPAAPAALPEPLHADEPTTPVAAGPAVLEDEPPAEPATPAAPAESVLPATAARGGRHAKREPEHHKSFLRELPVLVIIAFVLALLIKHFLVQAFFIPSGSMEPTLHGCPGCRGDRVLVNKVPYHFRGPHRGEIVVFNGLDNFDEGVTFAKPSNPVSKALQKISSTIGLGTPDEKDYIKRVIGIAGDRVMCCDAQGRVVVTPKGGTPTPLEEPYVVQDDQTDNRYFCDAGTGKNLCPPGALGVAVPEGRLWVLGDNRGNSSDSRYHLNDAHRGTVPEDKVVGRAFAVVYPFDRAKILHVPSSFKDVALPAVPWLGGFLGAVPLVRVRRRLRRRHA